MRGVTPIAALALACALHLSAQQKPAAAPAATLTEMQKAIEEFKTQTRNLGLREESAKRRGAQGAKAVWHGRLFENLRNDFLDAVPHQVVQRGGDKSTLRRNQFGFNVAGPVIIPKLYDGRRATFFSLSYEGVREKVSRSVLRTIPTLPERAGDWSSTVDSNGSPLPVYDPLTTRRNPGFNPSEDVSVDNLEYLRDPFPLGRIPAGRLDPVAQNVLRHYPEPNIAVGPFFQNNYFVQSPETNIANGMIGKVDHTLRERHRLSAGFSYSNGFQGNAQWFPTPANPAPPDRSYHNRRGSLEHVFTLSPRTVNIATIEAVSDASTSGGSDDGKNWSASLGFPSPGGNAFPVFDLGPYMDVGRGYPESKNARNSFSATNNFSTRLGKHNVRVVSQLARAQVNFYGPSYPSGYFYFGAGLTSLPGIVNTGHNFASFLLGLSEYGSLSAVSSPSYWRRTSGLLGLHYSYEARKNLTFAFSLNANAATPRVEKYNRMATVDLDALNPSNGRKGALVFAGRGGYGQSFQKLQAGLDPSFSMSWNPGGDPKSVFRAQFARSHAAVPLYSNQWGTQGFNGRPTFFSANAQLDPAVTLQYGVPPLSVSYPDLRPDAANDTEADLMDRASRMATYQSAGISLERELPGAAVVTLNLGYAGGKNLYIGGGAANPNAVPLEALQFRDRLNDEVFHRSLTPYPQFLGFQLSNSWPAGRYEREAASLRLEKRANAGLTVSAYYELSKQLDDYSGPYGTQDFFNRDNEWSLTPWNAPHRLSFTAVYELPIGAKKAFLSYSDWRRHLVDGWSVSQVSSFSSGYPLALRPQFNNTGGVVQALRVNVVPGVDPHVSDPGPELWFNPDAFDQPPDFTLGDGPRTHPSLYGPKSQNHDLSLTKRFSLASDRTVEFSAMGLNYLNHANWNSPDVVIGPSSAPNANAGKIIGSSGGRVIQVGLRFSF